MGQCYVPALHHITVPIAPVPVCGKCLTGLLEEPFSCPSKPASATQCVGDTRALCAASSQLLVVDDKGGQNSCHVEHHDLRTVIRYIARVAAALHGFSVAPVGGRERRQLTGLTRAQKQSYHG